MAVAVSDSTTQSSVVNSQEAHPAFEALAAKVNAHTQSILFTSEDLENPHADMCLRYADVKRNFAESVFLS